MNITAFDTNNENVIKKKIENDNKNIYSKLKVIKAR